MIHGAGRYDFCLPNIFSDAMLIFTMQGFDREGNLKLFDLGLCKEEKVSLASQEKNGKYCMTGHTGSRRYMAPEGMC